MENIVAESIDLKLSIGIVQIAVSVAWDRCKKAQIRSRCFVVA